MSLIKSTVPVLMYDHIFMYVILLNFVLPTFSDGGKFAFFIYLVIAQDVLMGTLVRPSFRKQSADEQDLTITVMVMFLPKLDLTSSWT